MTAKVGQKLQNYFDDILVIGGGRRCFLSKFVSPEIIPNILKAKYSFESIIVHRHLCIVKVTVKAVGQNPMLWNMA